MPGEVVMAMEAINQRSKKIRDIIGVIDGMAFQANMLAQRSAEASKIGTSLDRLDAGGWLMADAGQTTSEIVGAVQRVSDILGEITAVSGEQSDGISHVHVAVNQLGQMTRKNAVLVEESAAADESLKDRAGRSAQVIQVVRLP